MLKVAKSSEGLMTKSIMIHDIDSNPLLISNLQKKSAGDRETARPSDKHADRQPPTETCTRIHGEAQIDTYGQTDKQTDTSHFGETHTDRDIYIYIYIYTYLGAALCRRPSLSLICDGLADVAFPFFSESDQLGHLMYAFKHTWHTYHVFGFPI